MDYFESLGDGWTIYLWLVVGASIICGQPIRYPVGVAQRTVR